jgi:hypothetical protein
MKSHEASEIVIKITFPACDPKIVSAYDGPSMATIGNLFNGGVYGLNEFCFQPSSPSGGKGMDDCENFRFL